MALVNKPDESIFASSAKQGEVDNFPDLLRGWGITFDQTQGIPPMEWFNFLFKRLDEKHTYLMQRGLPEWSATQDYTKGSCVQFDGVSYRALKKSKNNNPNESNSQYWVRWGFALSEIAQATLTQYGITKLYTGYDSQSENLALTPKTAYQLKQLIDSNTRALGNVIPNSKKSSAVDSNSEDTVATSKSVKTAYDKGVEAKTTAENAHSAANNAQHTANEGVSKANEANSNANGRVSKLGDTMTGPLSVPKIHLTANRTGESLKFGDDANIGIDFSVHNAEHPQAAIETIDVGNYSTDIRFHTTPRGSDYNRDRRHHIVTFGPEGHIWAKPYGWLHDYFHHAGKDYVQVTGSEHHGGLNILKPDGKNMRFERQNNAFKFWAQDAYEIFMPEKSGTVIVDTDISHATNGNNTAKVASEFALGELYKQTVTDIRLGALATRQLGSGSWTSHGNGYVVVGFGNGYWDSLYANDDIHLRPIQKKVSGQWVTISNV